MKEAKEVMYAVFPEFIGNMIDVCQGLGVRDEWCLVGELCMELDRKHTPVYLYQCTKWPWIVHLYFM
jgi:hypothetical protein